jgi:large subunit ribosomal protein L25
LTVENVDKESTTMDATLEAVKRETRGKNEARRLRVAGRIPGVVYGGTNQEPQAVSVDPKVLSRILHSESGVNTLIDLKVDGGSTRVLVKDFLLDPVHHHLLHADFYRIALDKKLTVTVQIVLKGEPKGVKLQGGIVDFPHRDVEIECLPTEIPENLEIDVTELMLNDGVRLRDLAEGATWTPVTNPDTMLVHVIAVRAAEEAAAEPAAAAEPEVVKKGKTDKEDEKK